MFVRCLLVRDSVLLDLHCGVMIPSSRHILRPPSALLDRVVIWVATGGYSGYLSPVPATIGSFVGLLLYLPLAESPIVLQLALTGALFALGIWTSSRAEEIMKTKDARPIVIDEIVGMWISVLFLPNEVTWLLAAFLLFRLFDVLKPFPAKQAQELAGGWGVMTDDVIAGLYTNALLNFLQTF
ncbi:MAG: phosphatidylglycerophosphatase A [Gammaproteobacteria bacterium]|nr:phosphatidylglycerophosphatase A [Gammaproteobacteria bacterium]